MVGADISLTSRINEALKDSVKWTWFEGTRRKGFNLKKTVTEMVFHIVYPRLSFVV